MTTSTDMEADFITCLDDMLVERASLRRTTTTQDSMGNVATAQSTDVVIFCSIQPMTEKDRKHLPPGIMKEGTMKGYFKSSYSQFGTDYTVTEGDEIVRNSVTYRVIKIIGNYELQSNVVYIKAILKGE